ncbi:hypothetical protein [Falsiroseomonas oryziterrae]|uniref:hypothetical protein n=1 Tax=Falsiroseomonas oryziterrae TaxID=2911368 RepID=UPI001F48D94F|nr:hypothetical protein [Roseomonas sp. NPKOSM-4]
MHIPTLSKAEQISRLIGVAHQAGELHEAVWLAAVQRGEIAAAAVEPGGRIPLRVLDTQPGQRPLLILLRGDGVTPVGPDGFPQARRILRWARAIILHGAGAEPQHYATAVASAMATGRAVIVETTTAHLPAWRAVRDRVAANTPTLQIETRPGEPAHPVNTAPTGAVLQ